MRRKITAFLMLSVLATVLGCDPTASEEYLLLHSELEALEAELAAQESEYKALQADHEELSDETNALADEISVLRTPPQQRLARLEQELDGIGPHDRVLARSIHERVATIAEELCEGTGLKDEAEQLARRAERVMERLEAGQCPSGRWTLDLLREDLGSERSRYQTYEECQEAADWERRNSAEVGLNVVIDDCKCP